jgi:cytochrome P450
VVTPSFDPRDPRVRRDPYPAYAALRERDPVHHVASARTWFVADHRRCRMVLTDSRFSAAQGQDLRARSTPLPATMLSADPPEHSRLRAAASPAFTPAALSAVRGWLEPMVLDAIRGAVDTIRSGHEMDLVGQLAEPLAVRVLGRFLGLGDADLPTFASWGRAVSVNLDPFADPVPGGPAADAMQDMLGCFADLMHRPADEHGALTVLARSHSEGVLSAGEALSAAGLLVVGGLEPLVGFATASVANLLFAPVDGGVDATRPRFLVEELLRYDPPIQFTARRALADVDLEGAMIPGGDHVVALLGSANRDRGRFDHPDRLVLDRRVNPHLSFGAGPHVCLGAPLVRQLAELVVAAVPSDCPRLAVRELVRSDAVVPRSHTRLVVAEAIQP